MTLFESKKLPGVVAATPLKLPTVHWPAVVPTIPKTGTNTPSVPSTDVMLTEGVDVYPTPKFVIVTALMPPVFDRIEYWVVPSGIVVQAFSHVAICVVPSYE